MAPKRARSKASRLRKRKPASQVVEPQGIEAGSIVGDVTVRITPQAEMTFEASLPRVEAQFDLSTVRKPPVLMLDPADRIVLSGDSWAVQAEKSKHVSLEQLRKLQQTLAGMHPFDAPQGTRGNKSEIPIDSDTYHLLQSVVDSAIDLHRSPKLPATVVNAMRSLRDALQWIWENFDSFATRVTIHMLAFKELSEQLRVTIDALTKLIDKL